MCAEMRIRPNCLKNFAEHVAPFGPHVLFEDEMRFGTRTDLKRRWTPQGHRPQTPVKIGYEFAYLYLAICPYTGWLYAMLLPYANTASFTQFWQQLATELTAPTLVVADRASFHRTVEGTLLELVHLPTACPDLNPVERFFKELRGRLSNRVFSSLEQAYQAVEQTVIAFNQQPETVMNLTLFPYIQNAQNLS